MSQTALLTWGMPASFDPITADEQGIGIIVQLQRSNCGSTNWRQAGKIKSIVRPTKMVRPSLSAWMEERHLLA